MDYCTKSVVPRKIRSFEIVVLFGTVIPVRTPIKEVTVVRLNIST